MSDKPNWDLILKFALIGCMAVGAVFLWFFVSKGLGLGLAGITAWFTGGGKAVVKGVKSRAEKKHKKVVDGGPDNVQSDNLDRLRRRRKRRTSGTD